VDVYVDIQHGTAIATRPAAFDPNDAKRLQMEIKRPIDRLITATLTRSVLILSLSIASSDVYVANAQAADGSDLENQIRTFAIASLYADPPSMAPVPAGRIWSHLGSLYEDAGMYQQSEMAYMHSIRLFKTAPVSLVDLARALDGLGTLYMMRGETQLAERTERQALAIRQANGLTADLVPSWYHLATLALHEHQSAKAREFADRAIDQLRAQPRPDPDQQINAQFVLGLALCRLRRYSEAIGAMRAAIDLVRRNYRPEDFPAGFGSFLLGYAYWKSGDVASAQPLMHDGSVLVEKRLGLGHPVTLSVMMQYEHFLRATDQRSAARSIHDELKQARGLAGLRPDTEALSVASLF
jgi:tetratricopeptide (TPR) repeat protein